MIPRSLVRCRDRLRLALAANAPDMRPARLETLEPRLLFSTYYVSADIGNNLADGLSLATPFETIQKAADVAQPGDSVLIRGGIYRETVVVPRSGTGSNPIVFSNYNNENVVISGGDLVTGWTPFSGDIWTANANWNAGADRANNTLFVDGDYKYEARQFAENDIFDIDDWGLLKQGDLAANANSFTVDDLGGFANDFWNGAKVKFHTHDWVLETRTITDFSASSGRITFDSPVGIISQKQNNGYYIYDTLNAVDQPGEWYKQDGGNTLYYHAESGQNPNTLEVEFKNRAFGFHVRGRDYIHIQGIDFRGVSIDTDSNTDYNVYQGNHFDAYDKNNYGRFNITGDHNVFRDNEVSESYGTAMTIGGTGNQLVNNYFHDIGWQGKGHILASTGAESFLFSHNTAHTYARSAFNGYPVRSEIAYNHFENGGQLTWDTGVFDSDGGNGNSSYSIVHHNVFKNNNTRGIYQAFYGANNNLVIHHNLFYDFDSGSRTTFATGGTEFRQAYHNTIITDFDSRPEGDLEARDAVLTRYNNNLQTALDKMEALGVDMRGNHNYAPSDFTNFAGDDYTLAPGSDAIDTGIVIPGINDGYLGAAPDAGAFESGQATWEAGHDFAAPPSPAFNWTALPDTNLYTNGQFLQGIADWTIDAGTPNSQDRNSWNTAASGAALTGTFRTQSVEFTPGDAISRMFDNLKPNTAYTLGGVVRVINRINQGNQFAAVSGSVSTGTHRNEGYVTGLSGSEWVRYDNIDFGDAGQFDQIDLLHILDPSKFNTSAEYDGVVVQVRLGSATGQLIAELTDLTNSATQDRWLATRTDLIGTAGVTGTQSIYVSVTGTNAANLALSSFRLMKDSLPSDDLLTASVVTVGGTTTVAQFGDKDWQPSYELLTFTTGPTATSAQVLFANNGRINAYLDRIILIEGFGTRGGNPNDVSAALPVTLSDSPTTITTTTQLTDGSSASFALTSNDPGSFTQIDLGQHVPLHSIGMTTQATFASWMSNFRVSVWESDPSAGGTAVWSQDFLTDGSALSGTKQLLIQPSRLGLDGQTALGAVSGRFVRIELLGLNAGGNHFFGFSEIQVRSFDAVNYAVSDGTASQSSTAPNQGPDLAADNNLATISETLSSGNNSWWQTRITQPASIGQIVLVNRDDARFTELSDFTVSIWDEDPSVGGTKIWEKAYFPTGSVGSGEALAIDGGEIGADGYTRLASLHTARVVRVQLNGKNNDNNGTLGLAEVRIYPGDIARPESNLALNGIASQSSDHYGGDFGSAGASNNGLIVPGSDLSHTQNESGAWWKVELDRPSDLEQIVLFNRRDVAERLNDFRVSAWAGDPDAGGTQLWTKNYFYSSGAATYSTNTFIGPSGALIIRGSETSSGTRLDSLENVTHVRVRLDGTNFLSLSEVQVWGQATLDEVTVDLGQTTYNYDFGPSGSPVQSGWTAITPLTGGDIFWTGDTVDSLDRGSASGANNINRDFVMGAGASTLNHALADGIWRVTLNMGDADQARDLMGVRAEGQTISSVITSPAGQFSYVDANGASASPTSFEVAVSDGELTLEFFDDGGDPEWVVTRMTLVRVGDLSASVAGRHVFYKDSLAFNGSSDDSAIAPDKTALLPGQTASFANYTSYTAGINGLMIDINNLADAGVLSASDFAFKVGNNDDTSSWIAASPPTGFAVRAGEGVGGSDRVVLTWPNNVIQQQWLEVTVLANATTGLGAEDVFYFGNAIGESGNNPGGDAAVNTTDMLGARDNATAGALITNPYDYNRNGVVDITDTLTSFNNTTNLTTGLRLISLPSALQSSSLTLTQLALIAEQQATIFASSKADLDSDETDNTQAASLSLYEQLQGHTSSLAGPDDALIS